MGLCREQAGIDAAAGQRIWEGGLHLAEIHHLHPPDDPGSEPILRPLPEAGLQRPARLIGGERPRRRSMSAVRRSVVDP